MTIRRYRYINSSLHISREAGCFRGTRFDQNGIWANGWTEGRGSQRVEYRGRYTLLGSTSRESGASASSRRRYTTRVRSRKRDDRARGEGRRKTTLLPAAERRNDRRPKVASSSSASLKLVSRRRIRWPERAERTPFRRSTPRRGRPIAASRHGDGVRSRRLRGRVSPFHARWLPSRRRRLGARRPPFSEKDGSARRWRRSTHPAETTSSHRLNGARPSPHLASLHPVSRHNRFFFLFVRLDDEYERECHSGAVPDLPRISNRSRSRSRGRTTPHHTTLSPIIGTVSRRIPTSRPAQNITRSRTRHNWARNALVQFWFFFFFCSNAESNDGHTARCVVQTERKSRDFISTWSKERVEKPRLPTMRI